MVRSTEAENVGAYLAKQPWLTVFGVQYLHLQLEDGSDLYLTEYGRRFSRHLLPENHWADKEWFAGHSVRLRSTSAIYKITTKKVAGFAVQDNKPHHLIIRPTRSRELAKDRRDRILYALANFELLERTSLHEEA